MALENIRNKIDKIDKEMAILFSQRMELIELVKEEKKKNNLPTYNEAREKEIKAKNMLFVNSEYVEEYKEFIESILKISKEYQEK
ncbi:MAG: chorismate mutase [Coprobacillus sp.]|nr:chorismate mutase [Coprobacillus sp.]MDY4146247.1 chorismate mutase [Bacilli bacterium]